MILTLVLGDVLLLLAIANYLLAGDSVGRTAAEGLVEMIGVPLVLLSAALFVRGRHPAPVRRTKCRWHTGQAVFVALCVDVPRWRFGLGSGRAARCGTLVAPPTRAAYGAPRVGRPGSRRPRGAASRRLACAADPPLSRLQA